MENLTLSKILLNPDLKSKITKDWLEEQIHKYPYNKTLKRLQRERFPKNYFSSSSNKIEVNPVLAGILEAGAVNNTAIKEVELGSVVTNVELDHKEQESEKTIIQTEKHDLVEAEEKFKEEEVKVEEISPAVDVKEKLEEAAIDIESNEENVDVKDDSLLGEAALGAGAVTAGLAGMVKGTNDEKEINVVQRVVSDERLDINEDVKDATEEIIEPVEVAKEISLEESTLEASEKYDDLFEETIKKEKDVPITEPHVERTGIVGFLDRFERTMSGEEEVEQQEAGQQEIEENELEQEMAGSEQHIEEQQQEVEHRVIEEQEVVQLETEKHLQELSDPEEEIEQQEIGESQQEIEQQEIAQHEQVIEQQDQEMELQKDKEVMRSAVDPMYGSYETDESSDTAEFGDEVATDEVVKVFEEDNVSSTVEEMPIAKEKKAGKKKKKKKKKKFKHEFRWLSFTSEDYNFSDLDPFTQWVNSIDDPTPQMDVTKKKKKKKKKKKSKHSDSLKSKPGVISEPLAELLASQGHIGESIEMYQQLSLKYPEKSGFFAAKIENLKAKI